MTKTELIVRVCEQTEMTKKDAQMVIDTAIDQITRALSRGDSVRITGFGTFVVRKHAAREGRNPQTGKALKIAAHKAAGFRAGAELKKAVNKK
jgi:DNA-binding protein HU-beta